MSCFLNEASAGGVGLGDDPGDLRDDRYGNLLLGCLSDSCHAERSGRTYPYRPYGGGNRGISRGGCRQVPGARLILYPDAGHAFLFQDASSFIPAVERFLG
jgi:hypothetical protein